MSLYMCIFWCIKDKVPNFHLSNLWRDDFSSHSFNLRFPMPKSRKPIKSLHSPAYPLLFWAFHVLPWSFLPPPPPPKCMKQNSMQMHCSCKPAIRKLWIAFSMHHKHSLIATHSNGCKLTRMTQQWYYSTLWQYLYLLLFLVLALCSETFGCASSIGQCVLQNIYKRVRKKGRGLKIFLRMCFLLTSLHYS
jgi:hypothetical protein